MRTTSEVVRQAESRSMKPPQSTQEIEATSLHNLYEPEGNGPTALPCWAQACFLFGNAVMRWDDMQSRIIAGLSLPNRAYAALMIAAGLIIERARGATININSNFQHIAGLSPGTALVY